MKASLLSADVQSEIKQIHKVKGRNQFTKNHIVLGRYQQNEKLLCPNFTEQANRLKAAADQFNDVFKSDLKICLPKNGTSVTLLEFGDEINTIRTKFTTWKKVNVLDSCFDNLLTKFIQGADSLLELQQSTSSENNLKKSEVLLKRSIKDKSFPPFQKLCGSD